MPQLLRHQERFTWALTIVIFLLIGFVVYQSLNEDMHETPTTLTMPPFGEGGTTGSR